MLLQPLNQTRQHLDLLYNLINVFHLDLGGNRPFHRQYKENASSLSPSTENISVPDAVAMSHLLSSPSCLSACLAGFEGPSM